MLSGGRTGSFFPPLAGAAVGLSYARFGELFGTGVSISDDDVWALYSLRTRPFILFKRSPHHGFSNSTAS